MYFNFQYQLVYFYVDLCIFTRDGQLTGLPINRDILFVNNRYRALLPLSIYF